MRKNRKKQMQSEFARMNQYRLSYMPEEQGASWVYTKFDVQLPASMAYNSADAIAYLNRYAEMVCGLKFRGNCQVYCE